MCRTAIGVLGAKESRSVVDNATSEADAGWARLDMADTDLFVDLCWIPWTLQRVMSSLDLCLCESNIIR